MTRAQDRKNALEEYVYDIREKLEGQWKKYANAADKEALRVLASESEDWLYSDEGASFFLLFFPAQRADNDAQVRTPPSRPTSPASTADRKSVV